MVDITTTDGDVGVTLDDTQQRIYKTASTTAIDIARSGTAVHHVAVALAHLVQAHLAITDGDRGVAVNRGHLTTTEDARLHPAVRHGHCGAAAHHTGILARVKRIKSFCCGFFCRRQSIHQIRQILITTVTTTIEAAEGVLGDVIFSKRFLNFATDSAAADDDRGVTLHLSHLATAIDTTSDDGTAIDCHCGRFGVSQFAPDGVEFAVELFNLTHATTKNVATLGVIEATVVCRCCFGDESVFIFCLLLRK